MDKRIVCGLFLAIFLTSAIAAQEASRSFYISPYFSHEVLFTPNEDKSFFDLYIVGFNNFGAEAGIDLKKTKLGLYYAYGKNPNPTNFNTTDGQDNEIEIRRAINMGAVFTKQVSSLKKTDSPVFNLGNRFELGYTHFKGVIIEDNGTDPEVENDYSRKVLSLELGPYIEFGKRSTEKNLAYFINLEPLFFRVTTKGLGVGVLRTSVSISF